MSSRRFRLRVTKSDVLRRRAARCRSELQLCNSRRPWRVAWFVKQDEYATAAWASIEDVADRTARADTQVRAVLGEVMAQRRSACVALDYVAALSPSTRANCWSLAESAGHEGWGRIQALLGSYRWDWKDLRARLAALAAAWLPGDPGDLIGPGIVIDETAQLKHGDATACVAPQHAGCTGKVENCVTTVFSAYVTTTGQAWVDFDVYMPARWADDLPRRRAAGIPADLEFATKPQLATRQLERLTAAGLPATWVAFDEVYGRSEHLRKTAARARLVRQRVQRAPLQRLGDDRHRRRRPVSAHPPADLPPGPVHLLPVLGAAGPARHHDLLHHHRRAPLARRRDLQDRQGRARLGPVPGPQLQRDLPTHRPGRPRPATLRRHPRRTDRQHPTPHRRKRQRARQPHHTRQSHQRSRPDHSPRRRARPQPRRKALPTRHRPHQAIHRRDHPARPPRHPIHHRAHQSSTPRVRAALVTPTPTPPSHGPLAPLQRPAPRRSRTRVTSRNRKEVTQCSHTGE